MKPICFISYEKHRGNLFVESNKVEFYGTIFPNICNAVTLLKHLKPTDTIKPFYYKSYRGFVVNGDETIVDTKETGGAKWFADQEYATLYLKSKPRYKI